MKGAIIKLDLSKAYDQVNWLSICLILTHVGFEVSFISWIMRFMMNISFVVLINGVVSSLFKAKRGLRKGCTLSLLFFLLLLKV